MGARELDHRTTLVIATTLSSTGMGMVDGTDSGSSAQRL